MSTLTFAVLLHGVRDCCKCPNRKRALNFHKPKTQNSLPEFTVELCYNNKATKKKETVPRTSWADQLSSERISAAMEERKETKIEEEKARKQFESQSRTNWQWVQRVVVHPGVRILAEVPERRERSAAWEHVRCSEEQSAHARARDVRGLRVTRVRERERKRRKGQSAGGRATRWVHWHPTVTDQCCPSNGLSLDPLVSKPLQKKTQKTKTKDLGWWLDSCRLQQVIYLIYFNIKSLSLSLSLSLSQYF
jgi:hypothetical protein